MSSSAVAPPVPTHPDHLQRRWRSIQARLEAVEAAADLFCRFNALARRLDAVQHALEQQAGGQCKTTSATSASTAAAAAAAAAAKAAEAAAAASRQAAYAAATGPDASPIQLRLVQELLDKGFSDFRFARVPEEYYGRPLEFRRECLQAASIDHLCKSIIMENTKAHPSVKGWDDPNNSKYYVVILQYTARLNADKLKNYIHKALNHGRLGKQYFNMRLCPEDVSDQLSGYEHNAVSPIGIKTPLPIIISHRILKLQPDFFFLGAGEVDLKVGFSAAEFVDKYQPMVVDCTYDAGDAGGGGGEGGDGEE